MKQEGEADTRIIVESNMKYGRKDREPYKGKNPRQGIIRAKDLTFLLFNGRDSPTISRTKKTHLTYNLIYGP